MRAVLSAAGLALDLSTGGIGDMTTGVKAAYRISLSLNTFPTITRLSRRVFSLAQPCSTVSGIRGRPL